MQKKSLLLFFVSVLLSSLTHAQVLFSDDFSAATVGRLSGYNNWDSNSSNCAQGGFCSAGCVSVNVAATALTSPVAGYFNSPKSVQLSSGVEGPGRCFDAVLTPSTTSSEVVYMAALVNFSACPDNTGTSKGDFLRFVSGPFAVFARVGASGSGGSLKFRIGADSNAGIVETPAGSTYALNQTHLIVLKYTFISGAADQVRLYVNPPSNAEPVSALATINSSGINPDPTTFKGLQFNTFNAVSTTGLPTGFVGSLRITRKWSDLFATGTSKVISTNNTSNSLIINSISPIPTHNEAVTVNFQSLSGEVNIEVKDIVGKTVYQQKEIVREGENTRQVPLSMVANGLYFLSISDGRNRVTEKIIKQ